MREDRAFTLIELLVVLGLMVFLAGTVAWTGRAGAGGEAAFQANVMAASRFIRLAQDDARAHGRPVRVVAEPPRDDAGEGWRLAMVRKHDSETAIWDQFGPDLKLPVGMEPVTDPMSRPAWRRPEAMTTGEGGSLAGFYIELDPNGRPVSGVGRIAFVSGADSSSVGESNPAGMRGFWISSGGEISLD